MYNPLMDQGSLESALAGLPLGWVRYYERVGSTNDEALSWIVQGAPDLSLVIANEQTAGRGRAGRTWRTIPEAALAMSLVLFPKPEKAEALTQVTALGALAVCDALKDRYGLSAQIKWPNDVLVNRQKIAGVLVETQWTGSQPGPLVIGIGLNVKAEAAGAGASPTQELIFPAASLEGILGQPVDRLELLRALLEKLTFWREKLGLRIFVKSWEAKLAFRGEWVQLSRGENGGKEPPAGGIGRGALMAEGQIVGLAPDGSLKLKTRSGEVTTFRMGEVRLLPAS